MSLEVKISFGRYSIPPIIATPIVVTPTSPVPPDKDVLDCDPANEVNLFKGVGFVQGSITSSALSLDITTGPKAQTTEWVIIPSGYKALKLNSFGNRLRVQTTDNTVSGTATYTDYGATTSGVSHTIPTGHTFIRVYFDYSDTVVTEPPSVLQDWYPTFPSYMEGLGVEYEPIPISGNIEGFPAYGDAVPAATDGEVYYDWIGVGNAQTVKFGIIGSYSGGGFPIQLYKMDGSVSNINHDTGAAFSQSLPNDTLAVRMGTRPTTNTTGLKIVEIVGGAAYDKLEQPYVCMVIDTGGG